MIPLNIFNEKMRLNQWLMVYLIAAFLLSCKIMYNQHGWVNTDSLLYFEQAKLIATGEFKLAFSMFSWIFYPALIALVHTITSFDIHTSAQILNALLFVLFVAGFQQILLESGAQLRTLHWAHLLLFSTPYIVGSVMGMLLRDQGFWAGLSWGLLFWMRFSQSHQLKYAVYFQLSVLIAMLFRIEAMAYLLSIPLLVLLQTTIPIKQRLWHWVKCNLLVTFSLIIIMLGLASGQLQTQQLGRLPEVIHHIAYLFTEIFTVMESKATIMGKLVLGGYLDDYARFSIWSSLFLIVCYKTLKVAGLPALLAILWPRQKWWKKLPKNFQQLALITMSTSFIVSFVTILNVFVLSSRYVIASGIVMLCLAAFAITDIQLHRSRWISRIFMLVLSLLLIHNLWDRSHEDLDRLAVDYIAKINPQQKPVFYDTENARFYAQQSYLGRIEGYLLFQSILKQQELEHYDYFMISLSRDEIDQDYESLAKRTFTQHNYRLVKTIEGWHNKTKALIYVKPTADQPREN